MHPASEACKESIVTWSVLKCLPRAGPAESMFGPGVSWLILIRIYLTLLFYIVGWWDMGSITANDYAKMMNVETALLPAVNPGTYLTTNLNKKLILHPSWSSYSYLSCSLSETETEFCEFLITLTCPCNRIRQSVLCGRTILSQRMINDDDDPGRPVLQVILLLLLLDIIILMSELLLRNVTMIVRLRNGMHGY